MRKGFVMDKFECKNCERAKEVGSCVLTVENGGNPVGTPELCPFMADVDITANWVRVVCD